MSSDDTCCAQKKKQGLPELPAGGYNTGLVIELKCTCPNNCCCGSTKVRQWRHSTCKCQSYINQYGDIFCKNFKDKPECDGYFIQHAKFQCSQAKQNGDQWYQFRSAAQFLMSVAQGLQAAEFQLDEMDIIAFSETLNKTVIERWSN